MSAQQILEKIRERRKRSGVVTEIDRILSIPTTAVNWKIGAEVAAKALTEQYARRGLDTPYPLRPIQGRALIELAKARASNVQGLGGFFPIGVGWGKTGIALLAGEVLQARRPVLFVPPDLVAQCLRDLTWWQRYYDFRLPSVFSAAQLSQPKSTGLLDTLAPDVIVIDEAHIFARRESVRTRRFIRYFVENAATRLVALSGTITRKSICDFAHLIEIALRDGTPLPLIDSLLDDWAAVIDADGEPDAGAWGSVGPLVDWYERKTGATGLLPKKDRKHYREAFGYRLKSTPGVIATADGPCDASIALRQVRPKTPPAILDALKKLQKDWELPDGTALVESLAFHRAAAQISSGYFMRWIWPEGEPDREWLDTRKHWFGFERSFIEYRSKPGLDSPALIQRAAAAGDLGKKAGNLWEAWIEIRDRYRTDGEYRPPVKTTWIEGGNGSQSFLVDFAIRWVWHNRANTNGGEGRALIWYSSPQLAGALRKRSEDLQPYGASFGVYGSGSDSPADFVDYPAISIRVHSKGKNLQAWADQLVLEPPTAGLTWQQLLGRTHRPGQKADRVACTIVGHTWFTRSALTRAIADARYIQQTGGGAQKLLIADWVL